MSKIKKVADRPNFPELEDSINKFWKDNDIFKKSVEERPIDDQYKFVDGPPFVSGSPHYGHLLTSVAKDVIPRYWTMKGKRVRRVWGWDCHGLAVENKVNQKLGLKGRKEIEESFGIDNYIEECYKYIESCSSDWRWYIDKIGRWVDIDNAYYTMNTDFMESVMWAFKQIYDNGYIYKGKRTSLYSTDTATPVSNFEVAMDVDNYRNIEDLSVFVKFKLNTLSEVLNEYKDKPIYLVAWTTTPWTMPSNFALAVNENAKYSLVEFNGEYLIVANDRLEHTFEVKPNDIGVSSDKTVRILKEFNGETLNGLDYEPLYDYFTKTKTKNDFKVYTSEEVVLNEGTGVLHLAPAFGEADFEMGKEFGLSSKEDIDEEGKMIVGSFIGIYLRDASPLITEELEKKGNLLRSQMYTHRLPFYRGDNPLIYMTQDSYFIDVQKIKDRMLELNQDINWIPKNIKNGRFGKTVKSSPDWSVSRTRFWATIMPIWKNKEGEELVIGSIEELAKYTDQITSKDENGKLKYFFDGKELDLHKHIMDKIILTKDGKEYKRIPEVLDCWMDSGSVPFAEYHYPFENKEIFEKKITADYIIEYTPQVRAWFNVLHRISTMLFDDLAFKNVICHGTLAGNDGRKMSKTYGNYPDPKEVLQNVGAEAFRLYMMSSGIMVGDDMNWSDEILKDQIKNVLLPIWNTYKYLSIYANISDWTPTTTQFTSTNLLDIWMREYMNKVTLEYSKRMEEYNIPASVRLIQESIDNISSWYIRRSRDRFAKKDPEALQTLYAALVQFIKTFAPQMPFLTEEIYQNLIVNTNIKDGHESIHLDFYPETKNEVNEKLLSDMETVRMVSSLGQSIRVTNGIKLRQPLIKAYVSLEDKDLCEIIKEELNVKEVVFSKTPVEKEGLITQSQTNEEGKEYFITLDTNMTPELKEEGDINDLMRSIQNIRKNKKMNMTDKASIEYFTNDEEFKKAVEKNKERIMKQVNAESLVFNTIVEGEKIKIEGKEVIIKI